METIIKIIAALVALEHFYIMWFEMFAWTSRGPKIFKSLPADLFPPTKALAANQGLYNGFLAAGLVWGLLVQDAAWGMHIITFFLACVAVAGMYGAATASKRIFFVQALPALIGLLLIVLS